MVTLQHVMPWGSEDISHWYTLSWTYWFEFEQIEIKVKLAYILIIL